MKQLIKAAAVAMILSAGIITAEAQVVVRARPARPSIVVKRPIAPGAGYVWVDEDWVMNGNNYVWKGGHWVAPPRRNAVYIKGHWKHTRRGWVWVPGRWR